MVSAYHTWSQLRVPIIVAVNLRTTIIPLLYYNRTSEPVHLVHKPIARGYSLWLFRNIVSFMGLSRVNSSPMSRSSRLCPAVYSSEWRDTWAGKWSRRSPDQQGNSYKFTKFSGAFEDTCIILSVINLVSCFDEQ